jgi:hypothetical protein
LQADFHTPPLRLIERFAATTRRDERSRISDAADIIAGHAAAMIL